MPKTAVNEHGQLRLGKHEIGFARQLAVSAPAGDARGAHDDDETKLGILVATPLDRRHDAAAVLRGENIGHADGYSLQDGLQ